MSAVRQSTVTTRRGAQLDNVQTRGMVREQQRKDDIRLQQQGIRKPNAALLEAKRKAKQQLVSGGTQDTQVKDIYQRAMDTLSMVRGETGLVYDDRMAEHRCLWEPEFPERPERYTRVMERCASLELVDRCKKIESRSGTLEEVLVKHTQEHYDLLQSTAQCSDEEQLEELSSRFDAVYLHPSTFDLSLLAVGSTIDLVDHILAGTVQNGMAVIRPPGHHAMKAEFNGYCYFNNVAVAAQRALDRGTAQRILIVDWDIHHGQATQQAFYDDPRVLYFSVHRYEHGMFWPNLRESDFDCVGEGAGRGYNFNVPLNAIGMTNADYLAIWQQILVPVGLEFQPDLVIVSAGYDAAYGCPEFGPDLVIVSAGFDSALGDEKGEMEITPACYAHLLAPLMSLAGGRVAVVLEGGYCLQSLAEGASLTLRTLLGDPCPVLVEPLSPPCDSIRETILNCVHAHRPYWKSLQTIGTYDLAELNNVQPQPDLHQVVQSYDWTEPRPDRFPTRASFPVQADDLKRTIGERLTQLEKDTNLKVPAIRVSFVYDELMLEHRNLFEDHPERPERISAIEQRFREYGLHDRLHRLPARAATTDELGTAHTRLHVSKMRKIAATADPSTGGDLQATGDAYNSVYFHEKTFECAAVAAGSVLQVVDHVLRGHSRSGVCVVRPPGHHAEADTPHGFCIFNNVAVAARCAVRDHGLKRVLIVDWDVHHGNGTQHIFADSPEVLYVSLHRYDEGAFFPKSADADYTVVGGGRGEGFNVNIPWNKKGMGDLEYALAFQRIVMPIAYEFEPELVLVSAGFDAAVGDPLGGCKVTPEAFGHFTTWLSSLAGGRVVVCLEGGYNVNSVAYAMTMCAKALLGDPMPAIQTSGRAPNASCVETIQNVLSVQQKYWKSLRFGARLPAGGSDASVDKLSKAFGGIDLAAGGVGGSASDGAGDEEAGAAGYTEPTTFKLDLAGFAEALGGDEMFAVYPLTDCPHLSTLGPDDDLTEIDTQRRCADCSAPTENWMCLHCRRICCGRFVNGHMVEHHGTHGEHTLTLSFADLSVWCYGCEAYVDNPRLFKYKNLAHLDKFGAEMLWSYGAAVELS